MRALALTLFFAAFAATAQTEQHPGYGVVEKVTKLTPPRSAAAGGSASPSERKAPAAYRVTVRMNDGRLEERDVAKLEVKVGERVLVTNAGDVIPD